MFREAPNYQPTTRLGLTMTAASHAPLIFNVQVSLGTASIPKGSYVAELSSSGLELKSKGKLVAKLAAPTAVSRLASSKLELATADGPITLQVVKLNGYIDLIADAVVDVLSAKKADLTPSHYEFPRFLLFVAAIPLSLIAVGGMIGGALGGAAAGLNFHIARQRKWAIPFRIIAMIGSLALAIVAYVAVVVAAFGVPLAKTTTKANTISIPSPSMTERNMEGVTPPAPPLHSVLKEFQQNRSVRIPIEKNDAICGVSTQASDSILVGHQEGTLSLYSLMKPQLGWTDIAKLPGAVTRITSITSDYYIVSVSEQNYLLTPSGKLLRFPWRWLCLPSDQMLFAVNEEKMLIGALNFGTIESAAQNSTNGLSSPIIADFPAHAVESKDGPAIVVPPPSDYNFQSISHAGRNPIALGFDNGRVAIRVSNEWIIERSREAPVTCFGNSSGIGFADGVVDSGIFVDELRYRKCGDKPITDLTSIQVWTIVVNSVGETWSFVRQSKEPPKRIFEAESIGPIRCVLPLNSAVAIVGQNSVAFVQTNLINEKLK